MNLFKGSLPFHFVLSLLLSLVLALCTHLGLLYARELPLFGNFILWAYSVNFLLAIVIFFSLYFFRQRFKHQIGFLYMAGSMLKFLIFFIVFYPVYKADGEMDSLEFAAFFVPYAICLILETFFASKMLHRLES